MWYREGTITFTQGSNTLVGVGTAWNVTANGVLPGMIVIGPDNKLYEIKRVTSDTNIVLSEPYTGETQSEVPCRIITTYEGDLTQFSARFTALMSRMSADSKSMRSWLTALDEVTIEREDGTEVTVKPLMQIVNEHNENVEWYKNNTDAIDAAGDKAREAAASAAAAAESANTAGEKASQASQSASAAASSQSAASASATAAKKSETNAESAYVAAAESASVASTKASEAATSASSASASKDAAKASETNASSSANAAASSATEAENSSKAAKASETNAKASETAAGQSASSANSSKSAAEASASAASASADSASSSATAAGKSAESASSSATTATAKATEATNQATAAKNSASAAKSSETNAKASEDNAASSKEAAAESASSASASATSASASKDEATKQASAAKGSASTASTKATEAAGSATAASQSKTAAESAATRAEAAADRAEEIAGAVAMEDASLTTKGVVKLSSAVDSTSESLAATPKAVKVANDNANSRLAKSQNGADIQDKSAFLDNVGVTSLTFMKNNGEMPLDADLNTFGPVKAYLGIWSKATSTNATLEKNFPEDGAVGVLEVFNGGNFAGMQRYTTRTGNVYMRNLSGTWNGSDGPWSYWRQIQSATRPLSTAIDLNTLGGAEHLGLWRNSSASIASFDRNYPEEGSYGQGLLEVLEGGGYSRTQRYTTRRGNVYVRCLSATWNAENPQWEPWSRVGHQSECRYYEGDLNDLTSPGIYSVTGKASNGPMLDAAGATLLGILEVIRRFDGVSVWQRYTTTGKEETTQGRTFERVYAGSTWTEWREVYNSFSLPLNLGIGGAVDLLPGLDWQTYDFIPGSLVTVKLNTMTNIPDGMDWGTIDGNYINIAVGPSDGTSNVRSMKVWRSTVSKANYRFFMVRISGNPGSRTISARRVPIIDEAQTWSAKQTFSAGLSGELSGNAATATKLQTARTIGGVSFNGTANIDLPGVNKAGNQSTTGNAATATKLQTARTIGGVSFDGTANINLPGVNATGNQNTTGNAATATKLQTARTINGVSFNGSANISIPTITSRGRVTALTGTTQGAVTGLQMYEAYNNGYPSAYGNVLHLKGATAVGEGELFIGWSGTSGAHAPVHVRSRRDTDTASWSEWAQVYTSKDSIPGVNATGNQNTTGNAASATKLQTARTIGGVSFNGTANINLPGVNTTGNQNTTGNAATATKLQTARKIAGVAFDGSADITLTAANLNAYTKTEVTNLLSSYASRSSLTGYSGNLDIIAETLVVKSGGSGGFAIWDIGTTTSGANMYIDPNPGINTVWRSTSSRRYKKDIETLQDRYADELLSLRPVWYRSICRGDRKDWGYYGLIAEEVGEIAPQYVHWREPTNNDSPEDISSNGMVAEGVMYERLVVPLIHHIQQLTKRVEELETKLNSPKE